MQDFWQQLKRPIFALAPMEDVTDVAFREIFARYGKPDVMFTEFVNIDGLLHPEGFKRLSIALKKTDNQKPIVAQIWGRDPEKFYKASQLISQMGFGGIDINMGCPQDKEVKLKTCAALIREPELAGEIIQATIEGSKISHTPAYGRIDKKLSHQKTHLPVSVKTRLGYSATDEMEGWLVYLLKHRLAAITIHARTKKEKSTVPAHWEKIKKAVEIRNRIQENAIAGEAKQSYQKPDQRGNLGLVAVKTLIIGNGDIKTREEADQRVKETGCDGIMIARGAFGNPWLFRKDNHQPSTKEKLRVMLEHARLFNELLGEHKPFIVMHKNFKAYASGFEGSFGLRTELMQVKSLEETEAAVRRFLGDGDFEQGAAV